VICQRCGIEENSTRMEQRKARKSEVLCVSCAARPQKFIQTEFGTCEPYAGPFDHYDNPLTETGELFRPGFRLCGKADCVAESHIRTFADVELEKERVDVSYRTGETLTVVQWWSKLSQELFKKY